MIVVIIEADDFAARLHLGFRLGAGHVDGDHEGDFRMQQHPQLVNTQGLDRPVEHDLSPLHLVAVLFQPLHDVAGIDGAVELSGLAGLPHQHDRGAFHLAGDRFGLLLAHQIAGFQLGPARFKQRHVAFVGTQRLALRQQEVARVAGLHRDDVAHLSQLLDPFQQNDFHIYSSFRSALAARSPLIWLHSPKPTTASQSPMKKTAT